MHHSIKSSVMKLISSGFKMERIEIYTDQYYELTHLKQMLDVLDINCVLDVGANRGQFAHQLRSIGYKGNIISFEPVKEVFEVLTESFTGDSKWSGHQIALGSKSESSIINVWDSNDMSSLLESTNLIECNSKTQDVTIKRLDDIFTSITKNITNPIVFLKMDTQGYDLEVFKGSEKCSKYIQGLLSEVSVQPLYKDMPHYTEALSSYEKSGFELFNLSVVNRISTGGLLELNALMKKVNKSEY